MLNNTDSLGQFVKVVFRTFDDAGDFADTAFGFTMLDTRNPGERSPFQVSV